MITTPEPASSWNHTRRLALAGLFCMAFHPALHAAVIWVPENLPKYDPATNPDAIDFSRAGFQDGWSVRQAWNSHLVYLPSPPSENATSLICETLETLGRSGGGTLRLGPGTWDIDHDRIRFAYDNVRLEGSGRDKTTIHTTSTVRSCSVTFVLGKSSTATYMGSQGYPDSWPRQARPGFVDRIWADTESNSSRIHVLNPTLSAGTDVIVCGSTTNSFIAEHNMTGVWSTAMDYPASLRRIEQVLPDGYILDMPLRYPIKVRDSARVFPARGLVHNLSLADFTLQVERNPAGDFENGPAATATAYATAIMLVNVENALLENINVPLLPSRGIEVAYSRFVSVRDVSILESQNQNSWWNGYQFFVWGCDNLLQRCQARNGRRSFTLLMAMANGNVFTRCTSVRPRFVSDFHQHLSQVNLIDHFSGIGDHFESINRPFGVPLIHGISGTENVFWNNSSDQDTVVWSAQSGLGYVIGTRGPGKVKLDAASGTAALPPDIVEGEGRGETMWPQSLYEYQLAVRTGFPIPADSSLVED